MRIRQLRAMRIYADIYADSCTRPDRLNWI